ARGVHRGARDHGAAASEISRGDDHGGQVVITRRAFLGLTALAACDGREPTRGLLGLMGRANDRVQGALLSDREARRPRGITVDGAIPSYFVAPRMPIVPARWSLEVGGMVARPRRFAHDELQRLPRTDIRVEHHCVEGWSAVADW